MTWLAVNGRTVAPLEVALSFQGRSKGLLGRDGIGGTLMLRPAPATGYRLLATGYWPRDEVATAGRFFELHLRPLPDEAREIGASDVSVPARLMGGFPVNAGRTVLPIRRTGGEQ